ncbi:GerMN domain-containing protein [Krasilnikovia cinnamomea]|nr:GerMN domain-containing protein [Krasilnikovia cinnamomea]
MAVAGLVAGCGIPVERQPRTVEPPRGPFAGTAATTPAAPPQAGTVAQVLYFVRGGALVAVVRRVKNPPTVDGHLQQLLGGPTAAEAGTGLLNALAGNAVIAGVRVEGTRAIVELGDPPQGGSPRDEVLALGQVVCTLTARADIASVSFTHAGQPVGVPRADGSLTHSALTAADFAKLIAPA